MKRTLRPGQQAKRNRSIAVPLTDDEKNRLDVIKKATGMPIGFYVRDAILEKFARDGNVLKFPGADRVEAEER